MKGDNKGVSPVVGTILLIAVTVALAAVVATLVGGLGKTTITPNSTLRVTAEYGSDNVTLSIEHQGGDAVAVSDIKLIADNSETTQYEGDLEDLLPGVTTLTVGHTYTLAAYATSGLTAGETISVTLIYKPNNTQMSGSRTNVLLE